MTPRPAKGDNRSPVFDLQSGLLAFAGSSVRASLLSTSTSRGSSRRLPIIGRTHPYWVSVNLSSRQGRSTRPDGLARRSVDERTVAERATKVNDDARHTQVRRLAGRDVVVLGSDEDADRARVFLDVRCHNSVRCASGGYAEEDRPATGRRGRRSTNDRNRVLSLFVRAACREETARQEYPEQNRCVTPPPLSVPPGQKRR